LDGLRESLVIDFIHTSVPGDTPEDLTGLDFSNPEYRQRATAFAAAVAERYGDELDYLELGNEVNIYFNDHPEEVDPFLEFVRGAREAIHAVRPDLPVGTVVAFHELINNDQLDTLDNYKFGDFLAYTYYPHVPGFRYDGDPGVFAGVLDQMIERSGEMPFIIGENGWATAVSLGGAKRDKRITSVRPSPRWPHGVARLAGTCGSVFTMVSSRSARKAG
jgi:exo-beta-1,3-glucanase (GH17 family)